MKRKPREEIKLREYCNLADDRSQLWMASNDPREVLFTLNRKDGKPDAKIVEGKKTLACGDWCTIKTDKE